MQQCEPTGFEQCQVGRHKHLLQQALQRVAPCTQLASWLSSILAALVGTVLAGHVIGLGCKIAIEEGVLNEVDCSCLSAAQVPAAAGLRQWLGKGRVLGAGRPPSVAALVQLASCRTAQLLL